MKHPYWRRNVPQRPDHTRATRALDTRVMVPGRQGIAPVLAIDYLCDDGEVRTRIVGPQTDQVAVRKRAT